MATVQSPVSTPTSSQSGDDIEEIDFFLRALRVCEETIQKFKTAGYTEWTGQNGGGIVQTTSAIWEQLGIPLGDREKLAKGLEHYRNGTFMTNYLLPSGSMNFGQKVTINSKAFEGSAPTFLESSKHRIWLVAAVLILTSARCTESPYCGLVASFVVTVAYVYAQAQYFIVIAILSVLGVWAPTVATLLAPATPAAAAVIPVAAAVDCVDGDTKVLTVERKHVPVRSFKAGDLILSFTRKKYVVRRVLEVVHTPAVSADRLCRITFDGAEDVVATRNHPFFVKGKKWTAVSPSDQNVVKAKQLEVGDVCVDMDGKAVRVTGIKDMPSNTSQDVFNILIESPGTWFANSVLCHSGIRAVINGKENISNNV